MPNLVGGLICSPTLLGWTRAWHGVALTPVVLLFGMFTFHPPNSELMWVTGILNFELAAFISDWTAETAQRRAN